MSEAPDAAARTRAIHRAVSRFCRARGWAPLAEVPLPNGRRADILALLPDRRFICIEVKSGRADYESDRKWQEYRDYCDRLFFAVDPDFPRALIPETTGLIVAADGEAVELRAAPEHRLPTARRHALLAAFAALAADRLNTLLDPLPSATSRPD
ncbi:MAG: MmcB family DNA repair protein [Rhodospirillales bacterium]|nr:MmcB family DNA repair protein [Rhodospirillales bacterium]